MMSENTRNDKETNNIKLTNYVQALATTNDIEGTIDEVSNTTFHQPASDETYTPHIIAGQSVYKKNKTTLILGTTIVKRMQGRKFGRKVKQTVIVTSFPRA